MERRLHSDIAAAHQARAAESHGIDVERVCDVLRREVPSISRADLGRFAEVLRALAAAADLTELGEVGRVSSKAGLALPDDIHRRLLFACDMIFPDAALDGVHAFVGRNLGPTGLLRLRRLDSERREPRLGPVSEV